MAAKVNIAKHPVHPMLIPFPIGLWTFSLVSDIIFRAGGNPVWSTVAWYTMAGGIIGAIAAALPGLIDLLSIKSPVIKRLGTWHAILNVSALIVFVANFFLRMNAAPESIAPLILSIVGVGIIVVSGWLGGTMVYEHGAAVEREKTEIPETKADYLKKAA